MAQPAPAREPNVPTPYVDIYKDGGYLKKNPTWHVEESPFKAKYIMQLLKRHNLSPKTICEAGCGAGEVLRQLQLQMGADREFWGYDISPQAIDFSKPRENDKLHFKLADLGKEREVDFDLLLVLDVVEHLEDYFTFLRDIRPRAKDKIFHFPLDLSVQALLRKRGLMIRREMHAHLHYFTKDTALQSLKDTGYEVLDYFYLPRSNEIGPTLLQKAFNLPRALSFAIHKDLAVRVLGGYSLMILAS
jgi:cyclopropane fatty-acyl-phospholipid synthase-like methyltransferase